MDMQDLSTASMLEYEYKTLANAVIMPPSNYRQNTRHAKGKGPTARQQARLSLKAKRRKAYKKMGRKP